ncbi:MAG: sulfotransferase, partial [Acidobacteriota bacterium]|nr:sulfotransferase [Acidobacteriota bacterium]
RPFIADLFPDARYIHLIRHPQGVLGSFEKAVRDWPFVPDYWKTSREELFESWAKHEEWVLQNKEEAPGRVETVRMEDLVVKPIETMERVFEFLGLDMPGSIAETIKTWGVRPSPNHKYASLTLPDVPRARRIMELYEYDLAS